MRCIPLKSISLSLIRQPEDTVRVQPVQSTLVQPFCSKKSPPNFLSAPMFSSMVPVVDPNDPGIPNTAQVSNIVILVLPYTHCYLPFLSIGSGSVPCPYSRASRSRAGFISQVGPGYPPVRTRKCWKPKNRARPVISARP